MLLLTQWVSGLLLGWLPCAGERASVLWYLFLLMWYRMYQRIWMGFSSKLSTRQNRRVCPASGVCAVVLCRILDRWLRKPPAAGLACSIPP